MGSRGGGSRTRRDSHCSAIHRQLRRGVSAARHGTAQKRSFMRRDADPQGKPQRELGRPPLSVRAPSPEAPAEKASDFEGREFVRSQLQTRTLARKRPNEIYPADDDMTVAKMRTAPCFTSKIPAQPVQFPRTSPRLSLHAKSWDRELLMPQPGSAVIRRYATAQRVISWSWQRCHSQRHDSVARSSHERRVDIRLPTCLHSPHLDGSAITNVC